MKQNIVIKQINLRMISDAESVLPKVTLVEHGKNVHAKLRTYYYDYMVDELDIDEEIDESKVYDASYRYTYQGGCGYEESIRLSTQTIIDILDDKHESIFYSKEKAQEKLEEILEEARKKLEEEKLRKELEEYERLTRKFASNGTE